MFLIIFSFFQIRGEANIRLLIYVNLASIFMIRFLSYVNSPLTLYPSPVEGEGDEEETHLCVFKVMLNLITG